jgi:2-dehydropantoate 2-reductase
MRIAIIGAGAVGGYYGGRLAQHGADVHFLLRGDYEVVRRNGLIVQSHEGDFTLSPQQIHVYNDPAAMPAADLVIITLKATENEHLRRLVTPLLHATTAILTLQNGLGNEELLASLFGEKRIMGGLAFTCIHRGGPGIICHTDHGLIRVGEYSGPPVARTRQVHELFLRSRIRCELLESLAYGRWEKLVWNIPFNGLGALLDATTDRLLVDEHGAGLVADLMREVIAAAAACGVQLPGDMVETKIAQTRTMGAYRTSMQIDRQLGRPMEVQAIFGNPLAAAQGRGVPAPRLEMLTRALRLIGGIPLRTR